MEQQELDGMLWHARALMAEILVEHLAKVAFRALTSSEAAHERDQLRIVLEKAAQVVEHDVMKKAGMAEAERALLADEYHALFDVMKQRLGL